MISYYNNNFIFNIEKLNSRCYYFKKRSYSWKISNFTSFCIGKKYTASKIRVLLTNIIVVIFVLLLMQLAITNIMLKKY